MKQRSITIDPVAFTAQVDGKPVELTAKEWQMLYFLFLNAGKVISRTELAERFHWTGGGNSIQQSLTRLRKKIGGDIIKCVRGEGYIYITTGKEEEAA